MNINWKVVKIGMSNDKQSIATKELKVVRVFMVMGLKMFFILPIFVMY